MKKIFFLLLAILPLAALAQNENRRVSIEPHAGMTISKMHGGALTRDETWKTGWTAGGATSTSTTLTDVNYMLASYVGSDAAATTSVLRNSHHPANASYLVVNAHTSLWRNTFTIYLGGKTITSTASASTGDFTDFNIYPNSDYKINITINGGDLYDARVNYTLLGIYNGDVTLNPSNGENRSIDLE